MGQSKPTILITGASAGLGQEYARQLAECDSRQLLLVARRTERLELLRDEIGDKADIFTADLASYDSRCELIEFVKKSDYQIEMLINNAGFGTLGDFDSLDIDRELEMVELNCKAPLHLISAFNQQLIASGCGVVVNVCSTAAFQSLPFMSTYGATKAFLLSLTVALAAEYEDKIHFLAHCPGPTRTEFHLVVGLPEKLNFIPSANASKVVSQAIKRIYSRSGSIHVPGILNQFLCQLNRVFSRQCAASIVARTLRDIRK